jgi:hypothetical protein
MTAIRQRKSDIDYRVERQIITGMIVSKRFLRDIQPLLIRGNFQTEFARKVSAWCVTHYQNYQEAPRELIQDIFLNERKKMPQEQVELIQDFLASISEEYSRDEKNFNAPYIMDKAEEYFLGTSIKELNGEITKCLTGGRLIDAENIITNYRRPSRPQTVGVDPFRDKDFVSRLTVDEDNPDIVLTLPGALGIATGPLERGFLVALQAESGVGKTWWLAFLARRAVEEGFNVPFYSLEMSQEKMGIRFWQDLMGAPTLDAPIKIPIFDCKKNQDNTCDLEKRVGRGLLEDPGDQTWTTCDACRDNWGTDKVTTFMKEIKRDLFNSNSAVNKMERMAASSLHKKWGKINLAAFPENSFTTMDMFAHIDDLEYLDNLIPDVVVSDYADKHKWGIPGDPRNSIGQIWADYKRLAQEKHCLVITASQSNTERSGSSVGKGSWAENIEKRRKLDLGLALNQKDEDYEKGIMWVSIDKMRHGEKVVSSRIAVLQSLAIGHPYLDSCFVRRK